MLQKTGSTVRSKNTLQHVSTVSENRTSSRRTVSHVDLDYQFPKVPFCGSWTWTRRLSSDPRGSISTTSDTTASGPVTGKLNSHWSSIRCWWHQQVEKPCWCHWDTLMWSGVCVCVLPVRWTLLDTVCMFPLGSFLKHKQNLSEQVFIVWLNLLLWDHDDSFYNLTEWF